MLQKDAIDALQQADAIRAAQDTVLAALRGTPHGRQDFVALPSEFVTHDVEKYLPGRRRARGAMSTRLVSAFAAYVKAHKEAGCAVFVNPDDMTATAVLNLGTPATPGHADNTGKFTPQRTAAYAAMQAAIGRPLDQTTLAEFLEDWGMLGVVQCKKDDEDVSVGRAVAAVRKLSIEASRKFESSEQQLSASKSLMESVQAKSEDPLPTSIYFTCMPYPGLASRHFLLRTSVLTGRDKPQFVLRLVNAENHAEEIANEMVAQVSDSFGEDAEVIQVLVGTYQAKA